MSTYAAGAATYAAGAAGAAAATGGVPGMYLAVRSRAGIRSGERRLQLRRLDARHDRWRLPDKRHARGLRG